MSEISREHLLTALISGRGPAYLRGVNLSSMDLSKAGWLLEADLRGADLSNTSLGRSNLKGANLAGANLHSTNLLGANLEGANLLKAKANVANLSMANLRGANLRDATLISANLVRADLEEADLDGADLEGANLNGCNLRKARITNVNLKMTNLEGADLTDAVLDGMDLSAAGGPPKSRDFHGTITAIKLADLIQIGCLSGSALNIEVRSKGMKGNIYIGSGQVLHAVAGNVQGEDAFIQILGWDGGRFITYPYVPDGTCSIDKPLMQLMIQSHRRNDENEFAGKYSSLVQKAREFLPMEAHASGELITFLKRDGKKLNIQEKIEITDILDPEGEDEVLCSLSARGEILLAPLKLVDVDKGHPLYADIVEMR